MNTFNDIDSDLHVGMDPEIILKYHELINRARLSEFVLAVGEERELQGAEKELQDLLNLERNMLPLGILEYRDSPSVPEATETNTNPLKSNPFRSRVADHLAIPMPRINADEDSYSDLANHIRLEDPSKDYPPKGGISAVLSPRIIYRPYVLSEYGALFVYSRKDANLLTEMNAALRHHLNWTLSAELDRMIIASLVGTQDHYYMIQSSFHPLDKQDYTDLLDLLLYNRVDGLRAQRSRNVRQVVSPEVFRLLAQSGNSPGPSRSVLSILNSEGGGVNASIYLPKDRNNAQCQVVRIGNDRDAVFPIWEGVTLTKYVDPHSDMVKIVARVRARFELLRPDGFYFARLEIPSEEQKD